jgi:exopolyphosphatase
MASSLSKFLSSTRAACLRGHSAALPFTIVLGNPSADLDSFISAVVYAYFHSGFFRNEGARRLFIPVVNLPTTPAHDLWRLRPEFGTALKLAEKPIAGQDASNMSKDDNSTHLLEQLITIADIHAASRTTPVSLFAESPALISPASSKKDDYVLVDHNALSIPTYSMEDLNQHMKVTGCIDHHVDESFVPSGASPRIIKTGIGSCASLVVQYLHESRLWPIPDDEFITEELARLALVPILIDTADLTAEGKVSDTDRHAVEFLESFIPSDTTFNSRFGQREWNRQSFYDEIATSKANSLNLLTLPEIFERDFKEWTESTKEGEKLNIGVSSIVKPIGWLLQKAESVEEFLNQVQSFAHGSEHDLALFGIMTTSTSESGDFQRELFLIGSGITASKALKEFEAKATKELDLKPWDGSSELLGSMKARMSGRKGASCIWWQRDVAKSRKQVAPLLRDMAKEC